MDKRDFIAAFFFVQFFRGGFHINLPPGSFVERRPVFFAVLRLSFHRQNPMIVVASLARLLNGRSL